MPRIQLDESFFPALGRIAELQSDGLDDGVHMDAHSLADLVTWWPRIVSVSTRPPAICMEDDGCLALIWDPKMHPTYHRTTIVLRGHGYCDRRRTDVSRHDSRDGMLVVSAMVEGLEWPNE
jgi:hypothetical protein